MERTLTTPLPLRQFATIHFAKTTLIISLLASSFMATAAPVPLDKVVAVVDSNAILESDLNLAMSAARQRLNALQQPVPPNDALRTEVLRQLVLKQAELDRLKRAGITLDEDTLNAAVSEIARQEGINSLAEFQQKLDARAPGSYAALRQQVNQDLSLNRLRQQQVNARIKVSEQDIDNFLNSPQSASALQDEVRLAHLRVALPQDASTTQRQTATSIANKLSQELKQSSNIDSIVKQNQGAALQVEGADMGWRKLQALPAELAEQADSLENGEVGTPIRAPDGLHILKVLDRRGADERTIVKQYRVRHILIRPSEVVSENDAQQQINQLYKRASNHENFSDLASTFSNDPGSAANGGDLNWVSPGMMVPQFDEVMIKTPVGQISRPFQTQYGWHILKVEDTRQQNVTEQHKRNKARQILAARQFDQELDNWLREVRAEAFVEIKDGTDIN